MLGKLEWRVGAKLGGVNIWSGFIASTVAEDVATDHGPAARGGADHERPHPDRGVPDDAGDDVDDVRSLQYLGQRSG